MMPYGKKRVVIENGTQSVLLRQRHCFISYLCDHFEIIHQAIICPLLDCTLYLIKFFKINITALHTNDSESDWH